jgi:hypothetical protein
MLILIPYTDYTLYKLNISIVPSRSMMGAHSLTPKPSTSLRRS